MLIDQMRRVFSERCQKNPAYSLRAFSNSLGMDSSTISAIMNGRRPLTIKSARRILDGLNIVNPVEAQALLAATFAFDQAADADYQQLSIEAAEAIAYWQHFAILAALELKRLKPTGRNIAEHLGIPIGIVWECLGRLERLGLIKKDGTLWRLTGTNLATPSDVPSASIREGNRQNILKALDSLENDAVDARDISGITMAIAKARLPEAKKMIREFRRRLSCFLEDGHQDSVYRLNIQLFPISQEKRK